MVVNSQATGEERDLTADAEGDFSVQFLPPGKYDLTVRAAGFEPFTLNGVQVQITEVSRLKIRLALSGAKQQIVVSAAPRLLQTENATLGRVIDHEAIVDLPLVDRNFTEILGLTAGTNTNIVDATQLGAGSQEIRANGARSGDNNFMLNGVDANSYSSNITEVTPFGGAGIAIPAPDTIQEFKVQTSLYDAQYGRGAGANVDIETRSGTANFHGNAYYFGRNEALDANNFFANATGVPKRRISAFATRGHFGWAGALVKEARLFLCFVSSHQGCECGLLEQQCQFFKPSAYTASPHAGLAGSCIWRQNRGIRWCGGRPGRFKYQPGRPQSSEREERRWNICNSEPSNVRQRCQLHGCCAWPLQRRPVQYKLRLRFARGRSPVGEILFLKLEPGRSFLRRQRAWLSGAAFL